MQDILNFISEIQKDYIDFKRLRDQLSRVHDSDTSCVSYNKGGGTIPDLWTDIDNKYGGGSARDCWRYVCNEGKLMIDDKEIRNDQNLAEYITEQSPERLIEDHAAEYLYNDESLTCYNE